MNAVILAGSGEIEKIPGKSLAKINGKPMLSYVVDAARKTDMIGSIYVVGNDDIRGFCLENDLEFAEGGTDILDNLIKGIQRFKNDRRIIILTGDIPYITPEAIIDFIIRSEEIDADFCYPIVEKKTCEEKFPGTRRTYVTLKDGAFTGGNVFYLNPGIIERCMPVIRHVVQNRKNPAKIATILGPGLILAFLFKTLTIEMVEKKASRMLNITAKAIISPYAEIGNDVDKPEDLEMANQILM
ncbi:NTP transferase domain-containing protein [Calorimonas adulescens]|uniref:NTP transferase domain-containing protein n=1 Tax=Calorimonas adulescens TaxID=2606906 RepID=A0A5D8QFU7_9THEO|nr:NTP transferase domain-containing protein [Calorimonas adulescens]